MSFTIVGLQRTGTNYLERVIINNFGRGGLADIFWKHALPREVSPSTLSSTRVILNIRHPITWFQSCVSNNVADVLEARPSYFSGHRKMDGYANLYNDFYLEWMEQTPKYPIVTTKYEDVLSGNLSAFSPLARRAGKSLDQLRTDVRKVPHSIELSGDDLERHRRAECYIPKNTMLEFWRLIDRSLLDHFDYGIEDVIFTDDIGVRALAYKLLRRPWGLNEEEFERVLAVLTPKYAKNCQILQAAGREVAKRYGDQRRALNLFEAALLASECEREFYGVYSDLDALSVIEDIKSILPRITASRADESDNAPIPDYEDKYQQLHATLLGIFANAVAADSKSNATVVARCRNLVQQGDLLQRVGRLDEAEAVLNRAIALDFSSVSAHSLLGDILRHQGRLDEAAASLREAIRNSAEDASLRATLSDVLRRQGRLDEALESLQIALQFEPDHRDHLYALAEVQQRQGRLDEATNSLRHAIRFAPQDGHLHLALSEVLRRQDLISEALDEAAAAIVCPEADAWWFHHHACVALSVGRLDEASESLQTALQREPDKPDHLFVLAEIRQRQGRLDEAANSLRRAIQFAPHDGHLHFVLSDVLRRQGRAGEALDEAAAAIVCPGAEPWWFHHHACLALDVGKLDEASEGLQTALRFEPDSRDHLFVLADVQQRQGRLNEAANSLGRAIRLAAKDGCLHFVLSDVLKRQGRTNEALNEAAAAIECSGAEPWWFHHHARLASRLGKLDLAECSLRRALEFEPDNPRHLLALAKVLLRSSRHREAQTALRRAIRLDLRRRLARAQARLRAVFTGDR